MPYRITNSSTGPVLLRLRSGRTIHLRAGAQTGDLEGAEINGSPRIASLADRRLITVEDVTPPKAAAASRRRAAKRAGA